MRSLSNRERGYEVGRLGGTSSLQEILSRPVWAAQPPKRDEKSDLGAAGPPPHPHRLDGAHSGRKNKARGGRAAPTPPPRIHKAHASANSSASIGWRSRTGAES